MLFYSFLYSFLLKLHFSTCISAQHNFDLSNRKSTSSLNSFLKTCFKKDLFINLKVSFREKVRETETEMSLVHVSFYRWPRWAGWSWSRSFIMGSRDPNIHCFSKVITKELDWYGSSWDLNCCSFGMQALQPASLLTVPWHSPSGLKCLLNYV